MSADTDFDKAFADSYNEAHELYLESRLIECEEKLRIMLRDPDIPRYPLFKTLVLLGLISGDWYEASYYRLCAEKQWQTLRGWSPEGTNTTFDSQMKALRGDLIILNEALMEDAPFKLDSMNYLGGGTDSENSSIEEGRTGIESLDIDVPVPVVTIQEHHEDDMEMDTEPAEEPTADVKPTEDSTMYIKPAMDVKPAPKPLKKQRSQLRIKLDTVPPTNGDSNAVSYTNLPTPGAAAMVSRPSTPSGSALWAEVVATPTFTPPNCGITA